MDSIAAAPPTPIALDRQGVRRLVQDFYADVRRDPLLGPVFETALHDHWAAHLDRMVEFWCTVMLGTRSFKGNVYGKHVALAERSNVAPEHFLRWITLWHVHTSALFEAEVAAEFQRTAHGIGRNLFYGFFQQFAQFVVEDGVATDYIAV
jgi:hemoglobin